MTDKRAVVVSHGDEELTAVVVDVLKRDGWNTTDNPGGAVQGVVYIPGYAPENHDPATEFIDLVAALPGLADARVVAVTSRDWLGWPTRPKQAAQAAGLIAAVRSLAMSYGRSGVTVNAVVGMAPEGDGPKPLTPERVSAEDVANTVAFFLDERSAYITGQTLHCCGGASLLSSMSV